MRYKLRIVRKKRKHHRVTIYSDDSISWCLMTVIDACVSNLYWECEAPLSASCRNACIKLLRKSAFRTPGQSTQTQTDIRDLYCRESNRLRFEVVLKLIDIYTHCRYTFNILNYFCHDNSRRGWHGHVHDNVNVLGLGGIDLLRVPRLATANTSTTCCCEHLRDTGAAHITYE